MAKINKFESEKNKIIEYQGLIDEYYGQLVEKNVLNVYDSVEIPYKDYKVKTNHKDLFDEEEDKYLMCLMFKYGYRNWNPIKFHILMDPLMKFNLNMKMKTEQELLERANYLIMCLKMHKKKEIEKKNTPSTPIKAKSKKRTIKKVSKKKKKKTKK